MCVPLSCVCVWWLGKDKQALGVLIRLLKP